MPQPVTTPTWATDATFTTSPDAGENGNATKVDPGAPYKAQGLVPGLTFVGAYANWLFNAVCLWVAYLKNLHTDSDFLGFNYAWTGTHAHTNEVTYATPPDRVVLMPLSNFVPTTYAASNADRLGLGLGGIVLQGDGANPTRISADLHGMVPAGGTLKRVRISTGGVNLTAQLTFIIEDKVSPVDGDFVTIPGWTQTASATILDSGVLAVPADRDSLSMRLFLIGDVSSGFETEVHWVELTFSDTLATGH